MFSQFFIQRPIFATVLAIVILISQFNVPFFFGGTALLIVVGVAIDTVAQMQAHLIQRSYEGFMKKAKVRGRR